MSLVSGHIPQLRLQITPFPQYTHTAALSVIITRHAEDKKSAFEVCRLENKMAHNEMEVSGCRRTSLLSEKPLWVATRKCI